MRSQHQSHTATASASTSGTNYPEGRVDGPGLLYGGVGLALAATMQVIGLFKKGDARLQELLLDSVFQGTSPNHLSIAVLIVVAATFCFGLAFAVLDSARTWRRVILGVTALVVVFAMVPTFAVWNIYFSPFLPAIGIFWTWFCTMMYVNHHAMPCDSINTKLQTPDTHVVAAPQPVVEEKKIEFEKVHQKVAGKSSNKKLNKKTAKKKSKVPAKDPNAKYKPKDD